MPKPLQIVIPMAGRGERFQRAGYLEIKPLIRVEGRPMIEHVAGLFPGESRFVFVCAEDHLAQTPLRSELSRIAPQGQIVAIPPHKLGPVQSVLEASAAIDEQAPVIVSYCDFSLAWNYRGFLESITRQNCDGAIVCYRGFHPHTLGPNRYGYVRAIENRAVEVREKQSFTESPRDEWTSAGIYYFRSGELLLRLFEEARRQNLTAAGEFFASLPFNLLLKEGGNVRIFEAERFLQWGTPEDLCEYEGWSEYFRNSAGATKSTNKSPGTLLVPMAGEGRRFREAGHSMPKPLLEVDGRPMIARVLDSLPPYSETVVAASRAVAEHPKYQSSLPTTAKTTILTKTTRGAVETCLAVIDERDPEAPLFISACDSAFVYEMARWLEITQDLSIECAIWTFRNHPHANRHPKQYAWLRQSAGKPEGILCKQALSAKPEKDAGVTGTFWFRRARDFRAAAEKLVARGETINGEFYIDQVMDLYLREGHRAADFPVKHYLCFGTPDDVRTFEYWARHFRITAGTEKRRRA